MRIFTIGHAPFDTVEGLIELLIPRVITVCVDVRSHSYTDTFPRFNQPLLEAALNRECIYYVYLGDVFADQLKAPTAEDIAESKSFAQAIDRIVETAQRQRIVLLGMETDPLQCRRAMLFCQTLSQFDFDIRHLHKDGSLESHRQLEDRLLLTLGLADPFLLAGEAQLSILNPTVTAAEKRSQKLEKAYQIQLQSISRLEMATPSHPQSPSVAERNRSQHPANN